MVYRAIALALLTTGATACFGVGGTTPASAVIPRDPTGSAKCRIAKSQANPLVTEWPASEKAHLEGLLSERAVVVSYTGCEMKILDACRVQGSYQFKRTTLSGDTIEINNEDDLYAKVPLGAVSLEGQLQASGRLAIRTTVVGQLRLTGQLPKVPGSRACEGVTHIVSSLSVGAFELVSGGQVAGSVGVDATVAGGGVKHRSAESTLRSAGDRKKCASTSSRGPHPDCRSPIQVFLTPVEHVAEPSEPEPTGPTDVPPKTPQVDVATEPARAKSVQVHFEPPADSGSWVLLGRKGELLCRLPCVRRVPNQSGFKVQLDAPRKEDIEVVAVPSDLGYSPGTNVRGVPRPGYNSNIAAAGFYLGIVGAVVGAALVAKYCAGGEQDDAKCGAGIGVLGGGGAIGVAGGIYWYATHVKEGLEMTLIGSETESASRPPRATILGPGYVRGWF